ncbi:MAG: leucyl aminopeptidase [Holosporales bacterium]|jgi:leucyl aminopeptidase|nr:leucyl aminopeptidase [Holosporales bacterium]
MNTTVIFSESLNTSSLDVVVIVSVEDGIGFIEKKLLLHVGKDIAGGIVKECNGLSYGKIRSFRTIATDGRLIKVIIASAGKRGSATRANIEKLGGYIYNAIKAKDAKIGIYNDIETGLELAAAYLASGLLLKSWTFDKYKSKPETQKISAIECKTCYSELNRDGFSFLESLADCVSLVKDMVTEPANVMNPDQVLEIATSLKQLGIKVSVLDQRDMEKVGMNAILGVGRGSAYPTYLIAMEYHTDKTKSKIALIGKGLTFDSGGLCLKPATKMGEMKGDMTGAAVVIGILKGLATQRAKVNIVGIIGVTENLISEKSLKPGDIVTSMSKKTIEIDNTDAEGRLVLADALWYAHEKFAPKMIIDIATLTGAIHVALGHEFAGLFSNSDRLAGELEKSGKIVGEKLWRLPLNPSFADDIKSVIADIKNVGSGRGAGSITAAMFLKEFVPDEIEWAHLDIASTGWDSRDRALSKKGATGFGVRLLIDFITRYYEDNARGDSVL